MMTIDVKITTVSIDSVWNKDTTTTTTIQQVSLVGAVHTWPAYLPSFSTRHKGFYNH